MIKWLKRLFHRHDWETQTVQSLKAEYWGGGERIGRRYYLRCKECGWVKKRDLI